MRRLLFLPIREPSNGYPGFLAGVLEADEEIQRGRWVRLVNPREAMTPEETEDQAPSEANLSLMEGICLSVGGVVTTLGMPVGGGFLGAADGRTMLDVVENRFFRTVALESRTGIPRVSFIRAMGDLGTPIALASDRSIDVEKAFPAAVPGYPYDRWTRLNDLESFFEDPAVDLAVGFRDADYTLPLRCVARDRRRLGKAISFVRELPTYHRLRSGTERDGFDDRGTFFDYEFEA